MHVVSEHPVNMGYDTSVRHALLASCLLSSPSTPLDTSSSDAINNALSWRVFVCPAHPSTVSMQGTELFDKVRKAKLLVVGAGGIGEPKLDML